MKELKYYILFVILIVYHLLFRTWWTPAMYYIGTYLTIVFLFYDKFKSTRNWNYIKLLCYFSLIGIYLITSIRPDIKEFYERLEIRKWALGFAGIGIVILMFFKRENKKRKDN